MSTSSTTGPSRPSPLAFPTLHLGSFHSLSPDSFPAISPTRVSPISPIGAASSPPFHPGGLNSSSGFLGSNRNQDETPVAGPSRTRLHSYHDSERASSRPSSAGSMLGAHRIRTADPIQSPSRSNLSPPAHPPPNGMLPPLPMLSPISPLRPPSPSDFIGSTASSIAYLKETPNGASAPLGPRQINGRNRPLGPSLTIHTTTPLTPSSARDRSPGPPSPARLRETANIPRRRTIIEASPVAKKASPVRMADVVGSMTPPEDGPQNASDLSKNDLDIIAMPVARPTPALSLDTRKPSENSRKDDEGVRVNGKDSPVSPTKRSLPRPPERSSFSERSDIKVNTPKALDSSPEITEKRLVSVSMPTPPPEQIQKPRSATLPTPSFYKSQQASTSASNLPIIAGLSEPGPYPSTSPNPGRNSQARLPSAGVGLGRPASKPTLQQPEEVCLECMMRDRDLADVDVQGPGVWERGSDMTWEDYRDREADLLRSLGSVSVLSRRSGDESRSSESEGANQRRDARRSLIRERDSRVKQVGWRGFKWEEEQGGEGLPRGFLGSKGGALTEDGIKAVMTKFPSASALRYNTLQVFLHDQYLLIQEIRQEAQRLGRFPDPDDIPTSWSTVSSHEKRASSSSWEPRHIREINQNIRSLAPPPTGLGVRPSPSSPADLAKLSIAPVERINRAQRPQTHFYPDREPTVRSPVSAGSNGRSELGRGFGGPIIRKNEEWDDGDPWGVSPDASLRPFSFAVRAGAAGGREGSESSHGRRSVFGRWGGSVTSLFGGSHGGSGSMMDMHLGLDADRRNRASAVSNQHAPRSVSLASPSRPSFFSSRASFADEQDTERRMPRNASSSRLSQWSRANVDDDEAEDKPKKKGFKGFLQKMKPKTGRKSSDRDIQPAVVSVRREDDNAPLAPPPPISYLVGRGDRKHSRDRSGSSASMLTDSQASTHHPQAPYPASPFGMRSVSAPLASSSSGGSQSVSPTSSRFINAGARRESYASVRRQSQILNEVGEEDDRRGSAVEVLSGQHLMIEEPISMRPSSGLAISHVAPHVATYPPISHRSQRMTPTFSNSTNTLVAPSLETPPAQYVGSLTMVSNSSPVFERGPIAYQPISPTQNPSLSPNRYKNLPPLPPSGQSGYTTPDSLNGQFGEQDFSLRGTIYDSRDPSPISQSRVSNHHQSRHLAAHRQDGYLPKQTQLTPRSSFDPSGQRPQQRLGDLSPRLAQSMYVQPSANASSNSFGRFFAKNGSSVHQQEQQQQQQGEWFGTEAEKKSVKSKGLKGIFGAHKGGRMA